MENHHNAINDVLTTYEIYKIQKEQKDCKIFKLPIKEKIYLNVPYKES